MKRRQFVKGAGGLSLAAGLSGMPATAAAQRPEFRWKMVTTWPKNSPGFGVSADFLARLIEEMSGGRIRITVYGARELVAPLQVFDTVADGDAEMGHGAAFYWASKVRAAQFFAAVPFGLNAQEMNAWLYKGEGLELWQELYAEYGLLPWACGNTGVQMGGWFNREINRIEDLQGLKMRIPGLGGEVLRRHGTQPVLLPGGEIFAALQRGDIDAAEWAAPYNDYAMGLYKVARYYYYPGWHEPGATLECLINKQAMERLPQDLQHIVKNAMRVANQDLLAELTAKNHRALLQLVKVHKVELRRFPEEVLQQLKQTSDEVVQQELTRDPRAVKIFESYDRFRQQVRAWHDVSELAYLQARDLS
ncbi:TRAP transporter substrate-binding protein [Neptuniibacter halophilus]|uniref:TRAP transporter substrate-binding protein n=1 Tax=Neptuniibacter halophilus TaxID=651666 RepID=UPI0025728FF2|nr:TRAP transporter substrate-binding protein [Neptuniibacter halophilus]